MSKVRIFALGGLEYPPDPAVDQDDVGEIAVTPSLPVVLAIVLLGMVIRMSAAFCRTGTMEAVVLILAFIIPFVGREDPTPVLRHIDQRHILSWRIHRVMGS